LGRKEGRMRQENRCGEGGVCDKKLKSVIPLRFQIIQTLSLLIELPIKILWANKIRNGRG
jgi:hypothetical protein